MSSGGLSRIHIKPRAIKALERKPAAKLATLKAARAALRFARVYAPKRTAHYVNSLGVRPGAGTSAYLTASDFKAWWIEKGALGRPHPFPARHVLKRAVETAGLHFKSRSK